MKRAGFTMIELIFVIVILGILAAVALPKFAGVAEQAQVGKLKAYVGTLNRTVAPSLWSQSVSSSNAGSVAFAAYTADIASVLPPLEQIQDDGSDFDPVTLEGNAAAAGFLIPRVGDAVGTAGAAATGTIGGTTYNIGYVDGNMTAAPQFWLDDSTNVISK